MWKILSKGPSGIRECERSEEGVAIGGDDAARSVRERMITLKKGEYCTTMYMTGAAESGVSRAQ